MELSKELYFSTGTLYSKELNSTEKLAICLIYSKFGFEESTISNEELGEHLFLSKSTASILFKSLSEKNFISIRYEYVRDKNGRMTKGIKQRYVKLTRLY